MGSISHTTPSHWSLITGRRFKPSWERLKPSSNLSDRTCYFFADLVYKRQQSLQNQHFAPPDTSIAKIRLL
ncbi:MAG TPA: hypothetical protein V6C85_09505 [Allocoleopsis sp.]